MQIYSNNSVEKECSLFHKNSFLSLHLIVTLDFFTAVSSLKKRMFFLMSMIVIPKNFNIKSSLLMTKSVLTLLTTSVF